VFANRYCLIGMESATLKRRLERSLPLCLLSVKKIGTRICADKRGFTAIEVTQLQPHPPAPSPKITGEGERQLRNFYSSKIRVYPRKSAYQLSVVDTQRPRLDL